MKTIKIKTCRDCPYVIKAICGSKFMCNHPKYMVKQPYAEDRVVDPDSIAEDICEL